MRKILIFGVVFSFLIAGLSMPAAFAGNKPAAMIVKVKGDVKVQRGAKQKAIKSKFALLMGDKILVADGSSALVLFANGKKITATSNLEINEASMKIEGKEVSVASSASSMLMGSMGGGDKNADLKAKGGVAGAVRAAAKTEVQILSYLNTSTINTRPVFAWEPSAPADGSEIILMNEDGDEIWTAKSEGKLIAYPEDATPLEQGLEYTVEIKSVIDGEEISSASTFYIFDEDETAEVNETVKGIKAEYAKDDDLIIQSLLLAEYFKEQELYMDAEDELKKLIALDAYDTGSMMALADVYDKTGNKGAFKEQIKKVEEVEKELGGADDF